MLESVKDLTHIRGKKIFIYRNGGARMGEEEKNENKVSGEKTKINFKVVKMHSGWMDVDITVDGESFFFSFDEVFEEIWDVMDFYIDIRDYGKNPDSASWADGKISLFWTGHECVRIEASPLPEDCFQFHIKLDPMDGSPMLFEKKICLARDELLESLDSFFRQILENEGFPAEFPAFCRLPDGDEDLMEGALGRESYARVLRKMLETHEMPKEFS